MNTKLVDRNRKMDKEKTKKCLRCGKEFKQRGSGKLEKKYCSTGCQHNQTSKKSSPKRKKTSTSSTYKKAKKAIKRLRSRY